MSDNQPLGQPPPTYAPSQPQILVAPLPDATSFFWGRTVQGEVFVKGLGAAAGSKGVRHLSIQLMLTDELPEHPVVHLYRGEAQVLWTFAPDISTSQQGSDANFSTSHRFTLDLPDRIHLQHSSDNVLPATLDLRSYGKGEVKWSLSVRLQLQSELIAEEVRVEGTPQEMDAAGVQATDPEVEVVVDKAGLTSRLLVDNPRPRLGSLLRLGVEVRPKDRVRTPVSGLASQPDPGVALRALRRVRVELYRRIYISSQHSTPTASSSSARPLADVNREHLTLLHSSGKSMRYPGANHPPLRVLFTLPTAQLGAVADQTWGEISMDTPYHRITYFVRVTFGFGALAEEAPESVRDWVLEQQINIRPKVWKEPRQAVMERGVMPQLAATEGRSEGTTDEEMARELYRLKGLDVVGSGGTYRAAESDDLPDFDQAGPSSTGPHRMTNDALPSFSESEAQAASGEAPVHPDLVPSERLVPVEHEEGLEITDENRATTVGRRGSLRGELGTWVEYDGYETFSVAPPDAAASYGASGSMDPPQPGEENEHVAGDLAVRLGLAQNGQVGGLELMEQLGLGEGTRVVDMQDDLPPGIDEPSLPALPTFNQSTQYNSHRYRVMPHSSDPQPPSTDDSTPGEAVIHDVSPPSFAASEAAQAVGEMASPGIVRTQIRRPSTHATLATAPPPHDHRGGEDPPGYFGTGAGGPPAYS